MTPRRARTWCWRTPTVRRSGRTALGLATVDVVARVAVNLLEPLGGLRRFAEPDPGRAARPGGGSLPRACPLGACNRSRSGLGWPDEAAAPGVPMVPDHAEFAAVRQIIRRRRGGLSFRDIAAELTAAGHREASAGAAEISPRPGPFLDLVATSGSSSACSSSPAASTHVPLGQSPPSSSLRPLFQHSEPSAR